MTLSHTLASFLFLTSASLLGAGCAPAQKTSECRAETSTLPADISTRLQQVQNHVGLLDNSSWPLPGATDQADRTMVVTCFSELSEILPLIVGDAPSSEFGVGLRVLKESQTQLSAANADQPAAPIVSSGLQATERLLRSLNKSHFDNDAALAKQLDSLKEKVGELDMSHDALSRVYAAQALRETTAILKQMSASLVERAGIEAKPADRKSVV